MLRSFFALIVAILVCGTIIGLVEYLGMMLVPPPEGFDPQSAVPGDLPAASILAVLVAWFLGPLCGGFLAARLAPHRPMIHALFVGLVFLGAGIYNLTVIPSPLWFWITGILAFPIAAALGGRLAISGALRKSLPPVGSALP